MCWWFKKKKIEKIDAQQLQLQNYYSSPKIILTQTKFRNYIAYFHETLPNSNIMLEAFFVKSENINDESCFEPKHPGALNNGFWHELEIVKPKLKVAIDQYMHANPHYKYWQVIIAEKEESKIARKVYLGLKEFWPKETCSKRFETQTEIEEKIIDAINKNDFPLI